MQMAEEEEGGVFPLASTADLDRLEQRLVDRGFMQRMVRITETVKPTTTNKM